VTAFARREPRAFILNEAFFVEPKDLAELLCRRFARIHADWESKSLSFRAEQGICCLLASGTSRSLTVCAKIAGVIQAEELLKMMRPLSLVATLLLSFTALAQQAAPPAPAIPSTGFAGLDQYRASRIAVFTDDYGQLARYREANAQLGAPVGGENRVIFFGDSITDGWHLDQYFPGKTTYINRGIGGQTTPQMLVRFRQDVINLRPKVVVILAGTNDIAGNTGPMRDEDIEANYASFAELARVHNIAVVFASVLPVHNYTERAKDFFAQRPPARILQLNTWLKDYCVQNKILYLDYFSALVDDKGMLKKELADDGLHPNAAGYKIMAPLAEAAIAKVLANKP
jgi:lysophospholipase L1-like esterase